MYALNPTAWLLLELCQGQDGDELDSAFRSALADLDPGAPCPDTWQILDDLVSKGILQTDPSTQNEEISS